MLGNLAWSPPWVGETMPFLPPKMTGNGKFIPPTSIYGDDWGMDAWFMIVFTHSNFIFTLPFVGPDSHPND